MRWSREAASTGAAVSRSGSRVGETARFLARDPSERGHGTVAQATVAVTVRLGRLRREPHRRSRVPPAPAIAGMFDLTRSAAVAAPLP
jgi:hypothetical protein